MMCPQLFTMCQFTCLCHPHPPRHVCTSHSFTLFYMHILKPFGFTQKQSLPKSLHLAMEEANLKKSDYAKKKSIRRRSQSYTRKSAHLNRLIDMAEARREIVNALHLHRLSSSSTPGTAGNGSWTSQNSYQLTESMPLPEPTWSTTPPTVVCAPVPSVEVLDFDWPENMCSSYTWWIGFLNSLNCKGNSELMVENSLGKDDLNVEKPYLGTNDDESPFLDEWLIFPAAEDQV